MKVKDYSINKELRELSENLIAARKRRKWSQQEMADRLQVSRLTVRRIEQNPASVSLEILLRTLKLFGMLQGFADIANPYRDLDAVKIELGALKNKKAPTISDEEVNF